MILELKSKIEGVEVFRDSKAFRKYQIVITDRLGDTHNVYFNSKPSIKQLKGYKEHFNIYTN